MTVSGSQPDSPVGGDGVETVAGSAAACPTGAISPKGDSGSGNDGSGELRAEAVKLARLLDPVAFGDLPKPHNLGQSFDQIQRQSAAMDHAMTALVHGYRIVNVDDDTVERVAEALRRVDRDQRYDQLEEVFGSDATGCGGAGHPEPCGGCIDCHSAMVANDLYSDSYCALVRSLARAAVQALRDGGTK